MTRLCLSADARETLSGRPVHTYVRIEAAGEQRRALGRLMVHRHHVVFVFHRVAAREQSSAAELDFFQHVLRDVLLVRYVADTDADDVLE